MHKTSHIKIKISCLSGPELHTCYRNFPRCKFFHNVILHQMNTKITTLHRRLKGTAALSRGRNITYCNCPIPGRILPYYTCASRFCHLTRAVVVVLSHWLASSARWPLRAAQEVFWIINEIGIDYYFNLHV
jgi:hypothetical protein